MSAITTLTIPKRTLDRGSRATRDGTPTPAYRTLDLYFADYDAASLAVLSDAAAALFTGLANANGNFTGLFSEVHPA